MRPDPSTFEDPIELLTLGTVLTLLKVTSVESYYKVRTPSKREGWVYAPNIRLNTLSGPPPALPECDDESADHSRYAMKTRAAGTAVPKPLTVGQMLTWVVPTGLPVSARTANGAIANRETVEDVYALTGFVRAVRFQADCDFHVQVASSAAENAPQVIVELPRVHKNGAGAVVGTAEHAVCSELRAWRRNRAHPETVWPR